MIIKQSYISTTVLPFKIVSKEQITREVKNHHIFPYHVKIYPTNKCSIRCPSCTFSKTNRNIEIPYNKLISITSALISHGTQAITVSGGGDPLEYSHIEDYLEYLNYCGIPVGIVTNGIFIGDIKPDILNKLIWCRISLGDHRPVEEINIDIARAIGIDWGFSYLVTGRPDIKNIIATLKIAEELNFTHVRFVDDIFDAQSELEYVKDTLAEKNIDTRLAIYQSTKNYTRGNPRCLVSLLKPVISPDGYVRPCCGTVYRNIPPIFNFDEECSMGDDIKAIYNNQYYFDGSKCQRCYEHETNAYLNSLWDADQIRHGEFI